MRCSPFGIARQCTRLRLQPTFCKQREKVGHPRILSPSYVGHPPMKLKQLAFLMVLSTGLFAQSGHWCSTKKLTVKAPEGIPLTFRLAEFSSMGTFSSGFVRAQNTGSVAIDSYLIVLDLTDSNGRHLLSVPLRNTGMHPQ